MLMYLLKLNKIYYLLLAYLLLSFIQPCPGISRQQWSRETILNHLELQNIIPYSMSENTINHLHQFINENSNTFDRIAQLETDPEFLPYIEEYNALKIQQLGQPIHPDIKIAFSRSTLRYLDYPYFDMTAFCEKFTRTVFIDHGSWNYHPEVFRELLIFHELGHCDLNRVHTNDFSIMNNSYTFNKLFIPYLLLAPGYAMDRDQDVKIIMDNYKNRFNSNLHRTLEASKENLFLETNNPTHLIPFLISLRSSLPYLEMSVFTFEQRLAINNWIIDTVLRKLELPDQKIQQEAELSNTEYLDNIIYGLQQGRNSQNTQRIDEVIAIIREVQENK